MKQESIPLPVLKQAVAEELSRRKEKRNARPTPTAQYIGISLATLWRWHSERSDFPRARKIGPRCTVWDLNEIDDWLSAQSQ